MYSGNQRSRRQPGPTLTGPGACSSLVSACRAARRRHASDMAERWLRTAGGDYPTLPRGARRRGETD